MQNTLTPARRLIVAADGSDPTGLAQTLQGTGVIIKENVSLMEMGCQARISQILRMNVGYFADLKLNDVRATMKRYGKMLQDLKPTIVTVMCTAPIEALADFKKELLGTEVLGVTVLTDVGEEECRSLYGRSIADQVQHLTERALKAGLDGIVCAPKEIALVRSVAGDTFTINTPNVRQASVPVTGDDQNPDRARTIAEAFRMGATRIVMGRPILQAPDPSATVRSIINEIVATTA